MGTVKGNHEPIIEAFLSGQSLSQIARRFEVPTSSVSRVLQFHGARVRGKMAKDPDRDKEIARRYAAGALTSVLAAEFGIGATTVRDLARRNGVPIRDRGQVERTFSAEELNEIHARWRAGEAKSAIAKSLAVSPITVIRVLRQAGVLPVNRARTGSNHPHWKGGRLVRHGYIALRAGPDYPYPSMVYSTGYVAEHRHVMASHLGRALRSTESVHHINGNPADNRLANLQLRQGKHGKHAALVCGDCGSANLVPHPILDEIA